ncbi:radical SAM family heme chaperone HemW [Helicobacter fennelliae]|mgnify:CR=1 FL=1|uniref:Heme chaperone HemW n=2 Tax=Helicobacter fennelliae TaxID=215 RepID=T1DWQ7_9HELI|nr:radical SAM family heme chaperone HemW [Helicobacter fennelliae]GAD19617.1 putative coproporphyrinogen III oxidase of BS HemN-type, oxygen-independent in heat shock gene cluster [Helicobacter fennelliae MRY12-0050]SQB98565.1 oxygen-independent coproporhyrinogen III oxidase HemN [Helicobacter fennelliae]STP07911.1 oxygen-independent coproporhyrinogen III oxidase HemN [Helicobacter fennelliae]STQ84182.1 oxygen-independent coproporhyrinogen III oxidase HemN [Helicobacter fennelliae]
MILYIHIPFCDHKCGYCTFNSYTDKHHLKSLYIQSLLQDIKATLRWWKIYHNGQNLDSIYIGGGTPNILDSRAYARIFECIYQFTSTPKEITIESNPNLLQKQWCKDLISFGINRISIGVQSFFDDTLVFLERKHTYKDIFKSIECARDFEHISIDLIYGTPFDSTQRLAEEIAYATSLPIDHLSAYSLTLEEGSSLHRRYHDIKPDMTKHNEYNEYGDSEYNNGEYVATLLREAGFMQYEVSNYARGYKSLHNLSYWRGDEYLGCGAGGFGRIKNVRYCGTHNIERYIQNPLYKHKEYLSIKDLDFERLFLGLRCEIGISTHNLNPKKVEILCSENKCMYLDHHSIRAKNFFLADEIALWLSS